MNWDWWTFIIGVVVGCVIIIGLLWMVVCYGLKENEKG